MELCSCSFCGKSRNEAKLISGPRVFICDECVALCNDILAEQLAPESGTMERARRKIAQAAPTDSNVLIVGARGVGKTFVARTIHRVSERIGAFVTVKCDGLADELEAQLMGVLEAARGGTVFLEHVGRLPPIVQALLLNVLEQSRPLDVRVLSASRDDLTAACADGTFRRDLAQRLSTVVIEIPPLLQRIDEVPRLVHDFLEDARREFGREISPRLTPEAMQRLRGYPWPGNVGQLRAVIRRALLVCHGAEIATEDLTIEMPPPSLATAPDRETASCSTTYDDVLRRVAEDLAASDSRESSRRLPARRSSEPPEETEPSCSLCDQPESEARMLFRGSGAFICDACVEEAQVATYSAEGRDTSSTSERTDVGCAFCGTPGPEVGHLVGVEDHQLICDGCLDNYDQFLGERFSASWPLGRTFTLRALYPAQTIDETAAHAREELARGAPCRLVILVHDDADPARHLLDRMKASLADIADFWETAPSVPGAALSVIALPVSRRP